MAPIELTSIDIGRAALKMAVTESRTEEQALRQQLMEQQGIQTVAIDFGGEFVPSVKKIIERAVVAAQRQGLVPSNHVGEGAVAGAVRRRWGRFRHRRSACQSAVKSVSPGRASTSVWRFIWESAC